MTKRMHGLAAVVGIAFALGQARLLIASEAAGESPIGNLTGPRLQVTVAGEGSQRRETLLVKVKDTWVPALTAASAVMLRTDNGMETCALTEVAPITGGLELTGGCGTVGSFEQRLLLTPEDDVLEVSTRVTLNKGVTVRSAEDRYDFVPARHAVVDEHTGPLDFVWSQNIKSEADDLVASNSFKSPVLMMQQGSVFAALLPRLNDRHVEVRALDLDVTSGPRPWMSFGAIPSEPHGHSYFRRAANTKLTPIANTVEYQYAILLSAQTPKLGYRRAVRLLWQRVGHPELLRSAGEQQNAVRAELRSFDSWRAEAWQTDTKRIYKSFACGERQCGTLESNRNPNGDWEHTTSDAWFNAWFETLRTAYGWYIHGRAIHDVTMMQQAESVLNLALSSPRKQGAFSTIYLVEEKKWLPGDGWASYGDSYHTFSMSWTAYWMLRWADDLMPERKAEIVRFVRPYGDFLLAHQHASGVIPSWYDAASLEPRSEFRDFNAETAPSALLLATLGTSTGDQRYIMAAERAMNFVTREVVPRQRWFDFETFLSCARKDYGFFDAWTAQYPQNNLAELQAPAAMLALYRITNKPEYMERGRAMLDYLLLTQQVWNNPQFTPMLLGGFTTQNTDDEWSDARQGYAATLLLDFYNATGDIEYLERSVAAARSTFAVAPWENWAHTGYLDEPGALTGFHWGTGSAMTSVEMLQPILGDGLIDLRARNGVGFDECSISGVEVTADTVSFQIASPDVERKFHLRFRGVDPARTYQVQWNGGPPQKTSGETLLRDGLSVGPLHKSDESTGRLRTPSAVQ